MGKRGRPSLPASDLRDVQLFFRVTKEKEREIRAMAMFKGTKMSEWIRGVVEKELARINGPGEPGPDMPKEPESPITESLQCGGSRPGKES